MRASRARLPARPYPDYSTEEAIMGFSVEADKPRRLLNVSYIQDVGPEEARCCFETVKMRLADLQPGFRFLTDFTQLESMEPSCSPYIQKIMDLCEKKGVALIVRVISDPHKDIGYNIMSLFHYTQDVTIVTCSSRDEAAKALED